ncbi:hypothetical protein [Enterobacter sp. Bisph1]|uniref:hypothetical protein n=1 Tax=Enterobacter sp. Bisph1 TaxID=1274399 RepID=UPI00057BDC30|nr:hypothetical protein [Enterobacter sp. Bisph1]
MNNFRLLSIALISLLFNGCAVSPPEKAECESQLQQSQSQVAANNFNAYIAGRGEMLLNCSASADSELERKASAFDDSISAQMEKNKQYNYLIARDSYDFQHSDYKNYSQYLEKQFDWYTRQAQSLSQHEPKRAWQAMSGFENEVAKYYREAGAAEAEYFLAKSYAERYKLGERSPELLAKFNDSLTITPFSTAAMYSTATSLADETGNKKIASMLSTQFQKLNSSWGNVPVEKRRYVRDKQTFLSVAEKLNAPVNTRQKQTLLELAGMRDRVDADNQQFAERQEQIRVQQAQDNAEFEQNKAAENDRFNSAVTGAAMGMVSEIAGGGNATQAALNATSDVAINTSSTPELLSDAKSGLNTLAQNENKCDFSTPSGFKQCCKNKIRGKFSSAQQSDGTVSLGCLHPDKVGTRQGCTYSGDKLIVNSCAISP